MDAPLYSYNVKIYPHDWFVAVRNLTTNKGSVYHNDNAALISAVLQNGVFCGWGSKTFDQYIIMGIYNGFTPEEVYSLQDYLRTGQSYWQHPKLSNSRLRLQDTDLSDDTSSYNIQMIAGHLNLPIPLYSVSENITRPLTKDEFNSIINTTIQYNKVISDVAKLRLSYLEAKESIGNMAGLGLDGLRYTNARLSSILLGSDSKPRTYTDARNYKYPDNILPEYIPNELFDFINRIYDTSLTDQQVFNGRRLVLKIGGCDITIANGGIHGSIPQYDSYNLPAGRILLILDVSGYYPSVIINNGYMSRSVKDPSIYAGVVATRKQAKAAGNKKVSDPLKTVVNSASGSMLSPNNPLYDPLMGRSVIISGQLYLTELLNHLAIDISGLKIVQGNTDGFTLECNESDVSAIFEIINEWQKRTGFVLEQVNDVSRIIQKDVNNYILLKNDGSITVKGGLKKGVVQTTDFKVNNNAPIISEAIINYIIHGVPIEKTISDCTDILKFQYISNPHNALKCFTVVNGVEQELPLVNRIYASTNNFRSSVYTINTKGERSKVQGMPDHCITDNDNVLSIKDIDKNFYITTACKLTEKYVGHAVDIVPLSFNKLNLIEEAEIDIGDFSVDSRPSMPSENDLYALEEQRSNELISDVDYNDRLAEIMPKFVNQIMVTYKDSIPDAVAAEFSDIHRRLLPSWITKTMLDAGKDEALFDKKGIKICNSFSRVLITPYGAFIEIPSDSINSKSVKMIPGEDAKVLPENQGKYNVILHTTQEDMSCKIGYRLTDSNKLGYLKDHYYVSVHEVVDNALLQEISSDPIIKMGLKQYGIDSLYKELEAEDSSFGGDYQAQSKTINDPFVEDLKKDYCIFVDTIEEQPYLCQCHIFYDPSNNPYLSIMRIPESAAATLFKGCKFDMDKFEDEMFYEAYHEDVLISDKSFGKSIDYVKKMVKKCPESLVSSGEVTKTLESNLMTFDVVKNELAEQRGD